MVNCYNLKSISVFESIFHGIAACTVILSNRNYGSESSQISLITSLDCELGMKIIKY